MSRPLYIAVDLGAGSGRVFLGGVEPGELLLEEARRFRYPPRNVRGRLRWDLGLILEEIRNGLRSAARRAADLGRPVSSIGIDGWGVDYGLLDASGALIADPVCYRDHRTAGVMDRVFERVSRAEIFERTGIQFLPFNTLFQAFADPRQFEGAIRMLLVPDLINYFLTGLIAAEYTNATTTQMVDARTGEWDLELLGDLGLPAGLLPAIVPAGSDLGPIRAELAAETGLRGVHVVAPATHDTGSAVAAAPLGAGSAYISSGTWSLIGVELERPLINEETARLNFTNEGGAFGTVRFLKNVMGLWIFESCRREWESRGLDADHGTLLSEIDEAAGFEAFIFPDDERFLNPPSMLAAVGEQLRETGQTPMDHPARLSKVIFDSLAFRYGSVLSSISLVTGRVLTDIFVLGGGGRNRYLNQITADAANLRVRAGLTEATVVGNVLVQSIAAGRFGSLAEARDHVRTNAPLDEYIPRPTADLERARGRYAEIERRYLK